MNEVTQPERGRGKVLSAPAVVAALTAFLALAPLASAASDPVASGTTSILMKKGFIKTLKRNGVKVQKVSPGTLSGQTLAATVGLPVKEGEVDPITGAATLTHEGGFKFKHGKKKAAVTEVVLTTSDSLADRQGRRQEDEVRLGRRLHDHPQRLRRQLHRHEAEADQQGGQAAEQEARLPRQEEEEDQTGECQQEGQAAVPGEPGLRKRLRRNPAEDADRAARRQGDPENRPANGEKIPGKSLSKSYRSHRPKRNWRCRPASSSRSPAAPSRPNATSGKVADLGRVKLIQEPELAPDPW